MMRQEKFKPYWANDYYSDGRAMRMPPDNTVPRERALDAIDAAAGDRGAGAARPRALRHPLRRLPRLRRRRRQRGGVEDVAARAADAGRRQGARVPGREDLRRRHQRLRLHAEVRRRNLASQDRWAIANYIKALQLSQHASVDDVPADKRGELDKPIETDGRSAEARRSRRTRNERPEGNRAAARAVGRRRPQHDGRRRSSASSASLVVRVDELARRPSAPPSRGCGPSSSG